MFDQPSTVLKGSKASACLLVFGMEEEAMPTTKEGMTGKDQEVLAEHETLSGKGSTLTDTQPRTGCGLVVS